MRVLALLSALCLIGALTLMTLWRPETTLGHLLFTMMPNHLAAVQDRLMASMPWLWNRIAVPLLMRPAWLLPLAMGLVFGGGAYSLRLRRLT